LEAESGGLYARRIIKSVKKRRKRGPKKGGPGPPGRGVLRFLAQAYRRPVHFSAKIAVFSKNLQI